MAEFCSGPATEKFEYTVPDYRRLVGYVGVSDLAPSPWKAEFQFLVNQRPVKTYRVSSGARAAPIDVPLIPGARLLIRVTTHEVGQGRTCDGSKPRGPVLASPRLLR